MENKKDLENFDDGLTQVSSKNIFERFKKDMENYDKMQAKIIIQDNKDNIKMIYGMSGRVCWEIRLIRLKEEGMPEPIHDWAKRMKCIHNALKCEFEGEVKDES